MRCISTNLLRPRPVDFAYQRPVAQCPRTRRNGLDAQRSRAGFIFYVSCLADVRRIGFGVWRPLLRGPTIAAPAVARWSRAQRRRINNFNPRRPPRAGSNRLPSHAPWAPPSGRRQNRPIPRYFRELSATYRNGKAGWGGRDRTCECRYQKPVPYHLATPHPWRPRRRRDHARKPPPFASLHLIGPRPCHGHAAARRERCCSREILCGAPYLYCTAL